MVNDRLAAKAVVQRLDHRVLKTRHHGWKPWLSTENGFRELQPIDLLCGNDHQMKPLKNGRLREGVFQILSQYLCIALNYRIN